MTTQVLSTIDEWSKRLSYAPPPADPPRVAETLFTATGASKRTSSKREGRKARRRGARRVEKRTN